MSSAVANARDAILNVFGGYRHLSDGEFPSAVLVALLAECGCSPQSTRMALSRLTAKDILSRRRHGRTTHYRLSDHGRGLLDEGHARLFSFGRRPAWDGTWTVISYSIPEELRPLRHSLRQRLRFLGFTPLHQATCVAPHDRSDEALAILRELGVEERAQLFIGRPVDAERLVDAVWEHWGRDGREEGYSEFVARYEAVCSHVADIRMQQAFCWRMRLMQDFRACLVADPELPDQLSAQSRPRDRAVEVFTKAWELLGRGAESYVAACVTDGDVPAMAPAVGGAGSDHGDEPRMPLT